MKKLLYIDSVTMKILLRHYVDDYFILKDIRRDDFGVYIYDLEFHKDDDEGDFCSCIKTVYIYYDHEDKEYYGGVKEIQKVLYYRN